MEPSESNNAPPSNSIVELRTHLFDTLRALKDEKNPMELDRAKAIAEVSKTIIASAKVEVDYARVTGEFSGSGFLDSGAVTAKLPDGVKGVTTHRLK